MDTLKKAGAQVIEQSGESLSAERRKERPEAAIRALREWELLLVGGGQDDPGFE